MRRDQDEQERILEKKSHDKAKRMRHLNRHSLFDRNREMPSYLNQYYDPQTKSKILESLNMPIPNPLPPPSLYTISYYRRSCKPILLINQTGNGQNFDPHLTYESLWIVAGVDQIEEHSDYQQFVKQFQQNLPTYLNSKYSQIREIAAIAAGNRIIGRPEDILSIVNRDESQLWVLVNHIEDRKILNPSHLYPFMEKGTVIAFRTIFEMTNNYKDETIESILKNQLVQAMIINALENSNDEEIKLYTIRILGNILAEPEDYASNLMKHNLLDKIYPQLESHNKDIVKDSLWLLSNYVYENCTANEILYNTRLLERLIYMFRSIQDLALKQELYYIFLHIMEFGNKADVHRVVEQNKMLAQCQHDLVMEFQDQKLTIAILDFILKLIKLGDEFVSEDDVNPFILQCRQGELQIQVKKKTFDQNQTISNLSTDINDLIEDDS